MNRTKHFGLSLLALLCCIVVTAQTTSVTECEYWIDQQFDSRQTANMSAGELTTQLDMSALPLGLHSLAIRTGTSDGRWSPVLVKFFLVPQPGSTQENNLAGYEYWIDGNYDNKVSGTFSTGGIVTTDLDMSSLPIGLHSISFRALDDNGHVSSVLVKYFLVPENTSTTENSIAGYRYWFDKDMENIVEGEMTSSGTIATDIDVSALNAGLHLFNYQVKDAIGKYSATMMSFFTVPEQGGLVGDKIVAYDYWFNNNPRKRVEVTPTATLELNDIVIDMEGVEPETVPADYVFNSETKQVVFTFDVEFGLQVFNDLGTGSEAVTQTVGYEFTIDPLFVALTNEASNTKTAPQGGQVLGFSYAGAVGDSLHWEITGSDAKIDFYDADGNRITPEAKTIDDKNVLVIKMPTTTIYALSYGATTADEISVKVSQPIELTVVDATRKYGEENPTFTYTSKGAALAGEVAFITEAVATSTVGEYVVSINGSGITNSYVTLKPGKLTITKAPLAVGVEDCTITEGEALPKFILTFDGFKNNEDESVLTTQPTVTTDATETSAPGDYVLVVSGGEATNYELTYTNGKLTIQQGTGIEGIHLDKPMNVYTIDGVLVRSNVTSLKELPAGVYIINRKKVVVK